MFSVIYLSSTQMASCLCVTVTVSLDDFEQSFLFWIRHTLRTKDQAVFRRHVGGSAGQREWAEEAMLQQEVGLRECRREGGSKAV